MSGRALLLLCGAVLAWAGEAGAEPGPTGRCRFEPAGEGTVRAVTDGRTLVLDDDREVRLDGIEVPLPAPAAGEAMDDGRLAQAALAGLVLGKRIELRQRVRGQTDRYGRLRAHVQLAGSAENPVSHQMLAAGRARVAAQVGDRNCAAELLGHERAARNAGLGLWGGPYYAVLSASAGPELLEARGRFTLAEGKVLSVREAGGTIYVNFGRRGSQALTVTVLKRQERIFAAAGIAPNKLENRHVRVRGWLEERNGPRIEASGPEQIEMVDRN